MTLNVTIIMYTFNLLDKNITNKFSGGVFMAKDCSYKVSINFSIGKQAIFTLKTEEKRLQGIIIVIGKTPEVTKRKANGARLN